MKPISKYLPSSQWRPRKWTPSRLLPILFLALMVFGNTLVLTHRVAHVPIFQHDYPASHADAVSAEDAHHSHSELFSILFGHDAGERCQSWDAAAGSDVHLVDLPATAVCTDQSHVIATVSPQVITADLLGISLARAPPQI